MNINTNAYGAPTETLPDGVKLDVLSDELEEHHHILGRSGRWTLTGEVALISDPDPDMIGTGAMQVWSKTADGPWVWINPEGEPVEAGCPFGD